MLGYLELIALLVYGKLNHYVIMTQKKTIENSSNKLKQQQVQTGAASTSIRSSNDNKYKQQQVQVVYIAASTSSSSKFK